ncbi:hypothetical protein H0264_28845 [Nocardia huaxiensis]|uniref:Uncharacterized protein n=1 Tax=Nocardia huaxiensis TaxID=2755382 RepID=A0A7D6ZAT6_9NOCA|nr:hypothetical protein [Nocardia huaxiensis]QLY29258.1 hypothetical protein H0264_28845 [Nocardia huaxiensis]
MIINFIRRTIVPIGTSLIAIAAATTIAAPANASERREIVCNGNALMPKSIDTVHIQYGFTVDCTGRPEILAANTTLKKLQDGKVTNHSSRPNEVITLDASNRAEVWYTASCSLTSQQLGFFYTEVTLGAIGGGGADIREITPSNSMPLYC